MANDSSLLSNLEKIYKSQVLRGVFTSFPFSFFSNLENKDIQCDSNI